MVGGLFLPEMCLLVAFRSCTSIRGWLVLVEVGVELLFVMGLNGQWLPLAFFVVFVWLFLWPQAFWVLLMRYDLSIYIPSFSPGLSS